MLTDSHCHLDFPDFATELDDVVARAAAAGVTRMITISTCVSRIETYRALSERFANVWHSVGTHPHQAAAEPDVTVDQIVALSSHRKCVAIGEAGLDFHYDKSPRDVQEQVFRTHIKAAQVSGLPLVIHARDADDKMIDMLEEGASIAPFGAVLHCFSSGARLAEVGVKLGLILRYFDLQAR
jgi:TatD DNase family protein